MGFSLIDFFIMISVVAIIAWFATRSRRKRKYHIEERALLPEATVFTNSSPLLRIPQAEQGEEPYFLCFDTETVELLPKDFSLKCTEEGISSPPLVALSFNLLTREGHSLLTHSSILRSTAPITPSATLFHGITEEERATNGRNPQEEFHAFCQAFQLCRVVVAHNLASHKVFLDNDFRRYNLDPLPWEEKLSFCTMEEGYRYLKQVDPYYIGASPSLRLLYSKLYYDRYDMHYSESNKSMADLLLVSACLAFLYNE